MRTKKLMSAVTAFCLTATAMLGTAAMQASAAENKILTCDLRSDGKNEVVIYLETEKAIKRLGPHLSVYIDEVLMASVIDLIGEKNVKIVEKSIDNNRKKV